MFGLLKKKAILQPSPSVLEGFRVFLRRPCVNDYAQWVSVRSQNKEFLTPWEPTWADDALAEPYFRRRCGRQEREWRDDKAYAFLIFKKDSEELIGGININNICRAVAQFGSLGYWVSEKHQGQGYMSEALRLVIAYGFNELKIHRLHAGCLVRNERSKNLLSKLGFSEEGFAKKYLKINGMWQDHILFGLTVEDWQDQACPASPESIAGSNPSV